jgi:hypothetical protein
MSELHAGLGLRVRLWFGCIAGAFLGAAAVLWIASSLAPADALFDPALLGIWPWTAAMLCVAVGVGIAIWLDYGIVVHLRGLSRAMELGDPSALRGLPSAAGWGELSLTTEQIQELLTRRRDAERAADELDDLRLKLGRLRGAIDLHAPGDRWETHPALTGPLLPVVEALQRRFGENDEARFASRRAALEMRDEMMRSVEEARDTAEQAERAFVEATALISTVREVQRLSAELEAELATLRTAPRPATGDAVADVRGAAASAIEELVTASSESVEHLAGGLLKVQAIGEQVQQLGNRATLIALHVALEHGDPTPGAADEAGAPDDVLAPQLKALAFEVRSVTERTTELSRRIDQDVMEAVERMQRVRESVAARLEQLPVHPPRPAESTLSAAAPRLLERAREMIRDAAFKAEQLAATGEHASRSAERLAHRLEEETLAMEMLATSVGATPAELAERPLEDAAGSHAPNLRLLGPDDMHAGDENAAPRDEV